MIDSWRQAYERSKVIGWDFSVLDGVLTADEPWWDFEDAKTLVTYLALVP